MANLEFGNNFVYYKSKIVVTLLLGDCQVCRPKYANFEEKVFGGRRRVETGSPWFWALGRTDTD